MTTRLRWDDLPASVRARVAGALGAEVVATRPCRGGFSASTAELVTTSDGAKAFVKAVRPTDGGDSFANNEREAATLAALPGDVPAAALRDVFREGEWLVLVIEAAPGEMPAQPWRPAQLDRVVATLGELAAAATPCPVPDLAGTEQVLGPDLQGFARLAAAPPPGLDAWVAGRLPELVEASERGIAALAGDTLVHTDLRADNMLLAEDGTVTLVDWAHASCGSALTDRLQLLLSILDPDGVLRINARIDALLHLLRERWAD
ncbi:aminoglycoside phosphotransferase family protein [Brachybacterium squillarum]|uniref:aminoglycoside phosphotransferase family protein n=1 Tax=Brachybacterium squillarum TaxID=661979 RepID=UPI0002629447|nr:aminoglycoside phosphotransferase family protein [Brachybacterium squillarum]